MSAIGRGVFLVRACCRDHTYGVLRKVLLLLLLLLLLLSCCRC